MDRDGELGYLLGCFDVRGYTAVMVVWMCLESEWVGRGKGSALCGGDECIRVGTLVCVPISSAWSV